MRFDRFEDAGIGEQLPPDGVHLCEITACTEKASKKDSRVWTILTFTPSDPQYGSFDRWLNPDEKRHVKLALQLCTAIGLDEPDIRQDNTVGRRVMVTTQRAVRDGLPVLDNDGKQRLYVNAFGPAEVSFEQPAPVAAPPAPAPVAAKATTKRTASQKATASLDSPDDDIPF